MTPRKLSFKVLCPKTLKVILDPEDKPYVYIGWPTLHVHNVFIELLNSSSQILPCSTIILEQQDAC